jgi:hypothetical protein
MFNKAIYTLCNRMHPTRIKFYLFWLTVSKTVYRRYQVITLFVLKTRHVAIFIDDRQAQRMLEIRDELKNCVLSVVIGNWI